MTDQQQHGASEQTLRDERIPVVGLPWKVVTFDTYVVAAVVDSRGALVAEFYRVAGEDPVPVAEAVCRAVNQLGGYQSD